MEYDANSESRAGGNGSNDNGRTGTGVEERAKGGLKTAVSAATAQLGEDLHVLGSGLLSIEAKHRALMERLQQIAEQADQRTLRQFETMREEVATAHSQNRSLREDLEGLRTSFPELLGNQCARLDQTLQAAGQRVQDIEGRLGNAVQDIEGRLGNAVHAIQALEGHHGALRERLQPAEQKIAEAEQNWQRTVTHFEAAEQRFSLLGQQLEEAAQRIETADSNQGAMQQLLQAAEQRILLADQAIAAAAERHSALEQMLQGAENRIQSAENKQLAMEQMLHAAEQMLQAGEQKAQAMEQKLADADREGKELASQMKNRAQRLTAEWTDIKRAFDEQTTRRENIEISIGKLGQDVVELKGQFSELLTGPYERLKTIQGALKSYRRILLVCVIAFILILVMVGYLKLGQPGWEIVTPYLSQWLPGLTH